ncbi:MAG: 30S ribosomal protein S20 [bacterium]|nr:30S ribosomal protein S20 [bacterium]MDA1024434.1 30S ribosomal protein S20 [bacterium]
MPNLAQAKKALRQNDRRAARNKVKRDEIASLRRNFRKLVEAAKLDEAKMLYPTLQKKIDKAVKVGIFKTNKGSRLLSRMASKLKKIEVKTK